MSVSEQRYQAILAVIAEGRTVSEVAKQWKVSRQTVHAWLARYELEGLEGLADRSRLVNELAGIWAADFFVVQTLTMRTLYVFFFITHDIRELVQCSVTASPTAAWIWQQFINATPWGEQPAYLIHDRDAVCGKKLPPKLAGVGVRSVRTPVRAPRANGIAERVIRTIRQECLDHVIVLNEHHLGAVLKDFMSYYNEDRPHRALLQESPIPAPETPRDGPIQSRPVLGGLHHVYSRAA